MIEIDTANRILIDGKRCGLAVRQTAAGTEVYTSEGGPYRAHQMPAARYSLSHPAPHSGVPGVDQFERDIRALLSEAAR